MIILETDNKASLKINGLADSLQPSTSSAPPPAYEPPQAESSRLLQVQAQNLVQPSPVVEPALRRFFKALGVAVLVCILVSFLFGGTFAPHHRSGEWGLPVRIPSSHGRPLRCENNWRSTSRGTRYFHVARSFFSAQRPFPHSSRHAPLSGSALASKQFKLSKSSKLLYFLSRGGHATGFIHFEPVEYADDIRVEIQASHPERGALSALKVCVLKNKDGQGIGIYTPETRWGSNHPERSSPIVINIKVAIPIGGDSESSIKSLMTNLPLFAQSMGDFSGSEFRTNFAFESVALAGSNSVIRVQNVAARNVTISTSNAPITGHFLSDSKIRLETSNAPIETDIDLFIRGDTHDEQTSSLVMKTTNGALTSQIHLSLHHPSTKPYPGTRGSFAVTATTSNKALNLTFPLAPPLSHLTLDASTSNSKADVALHRSYEGDIELLTSNHAYARIDEEGKPSGWTLEKWRTNIGFVRGNAWWDKANKHKGSVQVKTTNAENTLSFVD